MPDSDDHGPVPAAGGVVLRSGDRGLEVVVIHRPKYDDWTLPKGKLDPDESFVGAAVREVEEETGLTCRPVRELPPVTYRDASGRAKLVRYWVMETLAGEIGERAPDAEVDRVRWVELAAAVELLSYERDRALLGEVRTDLPY